MKIDNNGIFKYILISVEHPELQEKMIFIRGDGESEYHKNIKIKFSTELIKNGVDEKSLTILCQGGGRIEKIGNKLKIFGYSYSYG